MPVATSARLITHLFRQKLEEEPTRAGFGRGLVLAGERDPNVVALCADLTESTKMEAFRDRFPERFIEVGVAEQNLVTVAAGLALAGKVPFVTSYAGFSPGRNWEQIRTTIALNQTDVKIIGSHAGVSVGPDGATHQMLEDIALMRVMPGMRVIYPADALEAEKATLAIAASEGAAYLRLARADTPIVTTSKTPFILGKGQIFWEGDRIAIIATGPLLYQALLAAHELETEDDIRICVINMPTIKPLDEKLVLEVAKTCEAVITVEEAQVAGGLGGAVAELLSEKLPTPLRRIGVQDHFGESGEPEELLEAFGLTAKYIKRAVAELLPKTRKRKDKK